MTEPYLSTELGGSNGNQAVEDVENEPTCESADVKMKGPCIKKNFLVCILIGIAAGSVIVSIISILVAAQRGTTSYNQASFELRRELEKLVLKYMDAEIRSNGEIRKETVNLRVTLENKIQDLMNITERNRANLSKETANIKSKLANIAQGIVNATKTKIDGSEKDTVKALRIVLDRIAHDIKNYTQHEVSLLKRVTLQQGTDTDGKLKLLELKAFELGSGLGRITDEISNISQQVAELSQFTGSSVDRFVSKMDGLYRLVGDVKDHIGRNLSVLRSTISDIHKTLNVLNETAHETQLLLNENARALAVLATVTERDSTTKATPSSVYPATTKTIDDVFYQLDNFNYSWFLGFYNDYDNSWDTHALSTRMTVTTDATTRPTSSSVIRLVNGGRSYGRVEILHNGYWGTICDDGWDTNDGNVVCRMLGFSRAISAPAEAEYGGGTGRILLDSVQCRGNESSILQCTKSEWGIHDCGHYEDASVRCV